MNVQKFTSIEVSVKLKSSIKKNLKWSKKKYLNQVFKEKENKV